MKSFIKLLSGCLLFLTVICSECYAVPNSLKNADDQKLDAILVVDASGSMRLTDPQRLRIQGAKLFLQFLKDGDHLAVLEFSKKTGTLLPFSKFSKEKSREFEKIVERAGDSGEYTNIFGAVKAAYQELEENGTDESVKHIILLSDGKMDPAPEDGTPFALTDELLEDLLPKLKEQKIQLHTLAFSEQADQRLLSKIAEETGGSHHYTANSEDIHKSFAELFLVLKKPQMLPLTKAGFRVDGEVQEATFYINHDEGKEIAVITPGGTRIDSDSSVPGLKWFTGSKFDVITMVSPEPGQWQVEGLERNEGYATVLTDLKLLTSWPTAQVEGVPELLEARLFESKKPIVLPRMTGVIKYAFQVTPTDKISEPIIREFLVDDGTNGDRIEGDGIFSRKITVDHPGDYKLQMIARAPTFERDQRINFRVKPRLISLSLATSEELGIEEHLIDEEKSEYFKIELSSEVREFLKIEVKLVAYDKKKKRYTLPLTRSDHGYIYPASRLPKIGEYTLKAFVEGEGKRKKKAKGFSRELRYFKKEEGVQEVQIVMKDDHKKEKEEKPSQNLDFLYILFVLICNSGVGSVCLSLIKKQQGSVEEVKVEGITDPKVFEKQLKKLRDKAAVVDIDLEDPVFTDESIEIRLLGDILESVPAEDEAEPVSEDEEGTELEEAEEDLAEAVDDGESSDSEEEPEEELLEDDDTEG